MPLTTGARLGPYTIVSALGAGGMGEVYRARDDRLHRDVAIKVMPGSVAGDPERRARFEREAQTVAALSHPSILAIFDTGVHDGEIYLVTELLEGETLRDRLSAGAIPIRKALDIAMQVAQGLAAAHDRQVIHRDLKPENIFLLADGRVKILDFGLARQSVAPSGVSETIAAVTDPGTAVGTVGYMAPEQVRGAHLDARTDIFGFGTVFYEMLTGQRAFRRDTTAETMTAILREDPPDVSTIRADLPPALDRILAHCLAKSPTERFQAARDIAFALESLSGPDRTTTTPSIDALVSNQRRFGFRHLAAASIVVGMLGVLGWWMASKLTGARDDRGGLVIGSAVQVTADDGLEIDPAISPDGKLVAYAAGPANHTRVFIRPVAGGRTIALSDDGAPIEYQPRWSPKGDQILYLTPNGVFRAATLGGAVQRVATPTDEAHPISAAAWSPDGRRVLLARLATLSVIDVDGRNERVLGGEGRDRLHSCDWSPRNDWIACVRGNASAVVPGTSFGNRAPSAIVLMPVSGGSLTDLTDQTVLNQSPVWGRDGRLYFVSDRQGPRDVYVVDVAPQGRIGGDPRRVTTGLGAWSIAFSDGGDHLAYMTYASSANLRSLPIPTAEVDTTDARVVTSGRQTIEGMRVSSSKGWLLYDSNLHQNYEIFRIPVGGGAPQRLTTNASDDFAPDLSPDDREVAYHSFQRGNRDIFVAPVDGGPAQPVAATPASERYPVWSPDGLKLAFYRDLRNGELVIVRRRQDGTWQEPMAVYEGMGRKGSWLRNSLELAYPQNGGVVIIPADGGKTRMAYAPTPNAGDPRVESVVVSPDGQTLYFKSHDPQGRASIWSVAVAGGKPQRLVRFLDAHESIRVDFAAGAGHFFFTVEDRQSDIWVAEVSAR